MLLQPKSIGPLTIRRRLGSDGLSDLYEGVLSVDTVRDVRIHRLNDWVTSDPPLLRALESRVGDLLALRHPRLIRVLDYVPHGDERYLVEEVVAGVDLEQFCQRLAERNITLPNHIFVHLAMQLCTSLEALHNRRGPVTGAQVVLHRATRPGAVHIGLDGSIRLGGYSLLPTPNLIPRSARRGPVSARTAFLAPEQVDDGDTATTATDIFSLGGTLYTMLTGEILFDAMSDLQAIHQIRKGASDDDVFEAECRLEGMGELLSRCMEAKPGARFPDVHAVRSALQALPVDLDASRITEDVLDLLAEIDLRPPSRVEAEPGIRARPQLTDDDILDGDDEPTAQDMRLQYGGDFIDDDTDPGPDADSRSETASKFAAALIGAEVDEEPISVSDQARPAPLPIGIGPSVASDMEEHTAKSIVDLADVTEQREVTEDGEGYEGTTPTPVPLSLPDDQSVDMQRPLLPPPPPVELVEADDEEDIIVPTFHPSMSGRLAVACIALAFAGGGLLSWSQAPAKRAALASARGNDATLMVAAATPAMEAPSVAGAPVAEATPSATPAPEPTPRPTPTAVKVAAIAAIAPPQENGSPATSPPKKDVEREAPVATPKPTPTPPPAKVAEEIAVAAVETPAPTPIAEPVATPAPKSTYKPPPRLRDAGDMGVRASRGALTAQERTYLATIPPDDTDFARAKMWLYEDATKRGNLAERKRHIDALVKVSTHANNPVYLVEAAEVAYAYKHYRSTISYTTRVDRLWGRLPQSIVYKRKRRIYEMAAESWSRIYAKDGSSASREDAIRAWTKFKTHVSKEPAQVARADKALAALNQ